jgi:hypothetical protein
MDILPPLVPEEHPDRQLWWEFALQAEFLMVAQRARELGWGEREIAAALVKLADHNMLALPTTSACRWRARTLTST